MPLDTIKIFLFSDNRDKLTTKLMKYKFRNPQLHEPLPWMAPTRPYVPMCKGCRGEINGRYFYEN